MTLVAAVGVLLAAAYMLWMVLRVVLGEPSYKVDGHPGRHRARDRACSRRSWSLTRRRRRVLEQPAQLREPGRHGARRSRSRGPGSMGSYLLIAPEIVVLATAIAVLFADVLVPRQRARGGVARCGRCRGGRRAGARRGRQGHDPAVRRPVRGRRDRPVRSRVARRCSPRCSCVWLAGAGLKRGARARSSRRSCCSRRSAACSWRRRAGLGRAAARARDRDDARVRAHGLRPRARAQPRGRAEVLPALDGREPAVPLRPLVRDRHVRLDAHRQDADGRGQRGPHRRAVPHRRPAREALRRAVPVVVARRLRRRARPPRSRSSPRCRRSPASSRSRASCSTSRRRCPRCGRCSVVAAVASLVIGNLAAYPQTDLQAAHGLLGRRARRLPARRSRRRRTRSSRRRRRRVGRPRGGGLLRARVRGAVDGRDVRRRRGGRHGRRASTAWRSAGRGSRG